MTWGVVFTVLAAAYLVVVGLCLWLEHVLVDCRREAGRLRAELNQQRQRNAEQQQARNSAAFTNYTIEADVSTYNRTCNHCGRPINGAWWVYQSGDYCDINCCLADGGTP